MTKAQSVNPELFDFLKESECGLYEEKGTVFAFVHVYPFEVGRFMELVKSLCGDSVFDDGGIECVMTNGKICVELERVFDYLGQEISDYQRCFENYDRYFPKEATT